MQHGGVLMLIDVLVADCVSYAESGGGGGMGVQGNLIMSGGAIRNCHAPNGGNGGGLFAMGELAQVQLSGTTVQGCTAVIASGGGMWIDGPNAQAQLNEVTVQGCIASYGGGMRIENGDAFIVDVSFEDCKGAFDGGAISQNVGSTLHANRVRVARCDMSHLASSGNGKTSVGGAVRLDGSSTWIDSIFADCFSSNRVLTLKGRHTLIRVTILRCHATRGEGGGVSRQAAE